MRHLILSMTLLASVTLAGTAGAGDPPQPPPSIAPTDAQDSTPPDWSKTHLQPAPALQEQIERTKAFMDDKESELDDEISRLSSEGHLDRRSSAKIRSALHEARDTMAGMTAEDPNEQQIDGWTARMIAYELGMAADTLEQQADKIETELNGVPKSDDRPHQDGAKVSDQQQLVHTLNETANLLRNIAQAIVRNLK